MEDQGCESSQRGKHVNSCLVEGGHTKGTGDTVVGALNTWSRVVKEGYEKCTKLWENKHKKCVERVIR